MAIHVEPGELRVHNEGEHLRVELAQTLGQTDEVAISVLLDKDPRATLLELQERALRTVALRLVRLADGVKRDIEAGAKKSGS